MPDKNNTRQAPSVLAFPINTSPTIPLIPAVFRNVIQSRDAAMPINIPPNKLDIGVKLLQSIEIDMMKTNKNLFN